MNNNSPIPEAIEFILEYQSGKYGYSIRGETKAFMYARALKAETYDQINKLHRACENYFHYAKLHLENFSEQICWVSQRGEIYYCDFGQHRLVAEYVFWTTEEEFEKTHAKVTKTTKNILEAIRYVQVKPSNTMMRVLNDIFKG